MVSEPPGPVLLGNISGSEVIELPTRKHKWTQEENRMLYKFYFQSDKNVSGYFKRMHQLWIEREDRDMTKQRVRVQVQNIKKQKLLSDMEIEEIVGAGKAEDDVEALNKEGDEFDGDLQSFP